MEQNTHTAESKENSSMVRIFDSITRAACIAFMAMLPAFLLPFAWVAIPQSKVILAVIFAVLIILPWTLARALEGEIRIPRGSLLYVGLLLPIAYVISTAVSGWNSTSLVGVGVEQDTLAAVLLWYAFFAVTVFVFQERKELIRTAVRALMLGLIVLAVLQILYIFFPAQFSLNVLTGATANPFGSWHDLGIIMGLSLFLSIALFRTSIVAGAWRALPALLGALSLFLILVIHFADVFWGVAALSVAGFVVVARAVFQGEGLSILSAAVRGLPWIICGLVMAVLGVYSVQFAEKLPAPLQISEVEVRPSWQGTFDVAKQSLDAPTSLLFGAGPNSFIREWGLHKPQDVNLTPFWNSDFNYGVGTIPTSIFAVGLFGLLAWASLLIIIGAFLVRFVREVRPLSAGRTLFGVLIIAVAYLIAFHMIYTPGVGVTGLTFILLGLLAVAAAGDAGPYRVPIGIRGTSIAGLLGLILFSGVSLASAGLIGREVISNLYVNRGAFVYQSNSDVAIAGRMIQSALAVAPNNDRAHRAAAELGIVELAQLLQNGAPQDEVAREQLQTTLQDTIQHGLTAVEIDGANYQNWLSLAQVYSNLAGANVEGAWASAKSAYESALSTQPTNPVPRLRLAQLAIAQGNISEARSNLQAAIQLKPDFATAYFLLSQVEAADGDGDEAVKAAAAAVQLVPSDPIGWFNLGYILYVAGSYENAAAALERAASLQTDYSNALFILGLSYNGMGRVDEAAIVLGRVAELNSGETWMPQLIQNIREKKDPFDGIQRAQ